MRILTQPFHDFHKMRTEGVRTRDGHLIREFCLSERVHDVLILNRPLSIAEALARGRLGEWLGDSLHFTRVRTSVPEPGLQVIQVVHPHLLCPLIERRDYWSRALTSRVVQKHILAELSIPKTVLLLSNPMAYPLLRRIPNDVVVAFDAIDDWANHPEISDSRGRIAVGYHEILRRADVVVTNSEVMQSRLRERGARRPALIRNGIPSGWLDLDPWVPPAGAVVIGYAGKIAKRIDVDTLSQLAVAHPEWRIEMAGPVLDEAWIAKLRRHSNIVWLGDVPHDQLPRLFRRWHVALIPHNVGRLENGGHPIKLYEYLALGLPIVSTPIGGIDALGPLPIVAAGGRSFVEAVQSALAPGSKTAEVVAQRRLAVSSFTWSQTAQLFLDLISSAQEERNADVNGAQ